MKHRFRKSEYGRYCFRCGLFDHSVESLECTAKFFPGETEVDIQKAEDWVTQPHDEERNVFAVRAFLAGMKEQARCSTTNT